MGEWANGRMGEWANGRMGEWQVLAQHLGSGATSPHVKERSVKNIEGNSEVVFDCEQYTSVSKKSQEQS